MDIVLHTFTNGRHEMFEQLRSLGCWNMDTIPVSAVHEAIKNGYTAVLRTLLVTCKYSKMDELDSQLLAKLCQDSSSMVAILRSANYKKLAQVTGKEVPAATKKKK